jgi:hypothetical protein
MSAQKQVLWALIAFGCLAGAGWPSVRAEDAPLVVKVRKAIDRGVAFLRSEENGNGNWEKDRESLKVPGGVTSLAALALLNAGVKPDDSIIDRVLRYERSVEPAWTYGVALQIMVLAEAGRDQDRIQIQKNVNWLINSRLMQGNVCLGWTYRPGESPIPDNSNTQYALLGLHAGHQAGAAIDRDVWKSIQHFYITSQLTDGGWRYSVPHLANSSLTMTTAGISGLVISGMELNKGREELMPDGTAKYCGKYAENRPMSRALEWVGREFRVELPANTFYSLYGIERAGRLTGQRFFGGHDWYREGCEYLVRTQHLGQQETGYWRDPNRAMDYGPIISTSFALLFLSKGRTPILVSKMVHGPAGDWNNDRNDMRNLVGYASKEVFPKVPLAWQVFDADKLDLPTNESVLKVIREDLLPSPILYFNGHEAPEFTDVEKKLLRNYIEQGGFLFAEACCGRKQFDQGFRALMNDLFPNNPLQKLPPEHPIWSAHALVPPDAFPLEGIDYGCKTVVIYSPTDLSCQWEANDYQKEGRGKLAFRLGGNLVAYATGMEVPKPRLTDAEVVKEDPAGKIIPRGYLKVAQLRHAGDWQPAPRAMFNLLGRLRDTDHLDVDLETKAVQPSDSTLLEYKFLYMHGRGAFTYSPDALKNLRMDLETGGLLFADACCGKKAFDAAFREMVKRLWPDKPLEPIPLNDDLYSPELNSGTPIERVRCRIDSSKDSGSVQAGIGQYRDAAPALEGIKIGGRWVVIYSKYDIGCALENHPSPDCLGHDHDSAVRLGSAAVRYALKR